MQNAKSDARITYLYLLIMLVVWAGMPFVSIAEEKALRPELVFEPKEVGPGDILLVAVKNVAGPVEGTFINRKVYFNPSKDSFKAVIGIDLYTEPGKYPLNILVNGAPMRQTITVHKKEYPIQRLTLPKDMVELSPENEARVERERLKMAAIWPNESQRVWAGDFMNPLEGEIVTTFGVRRIINKIPKNPHSGMDVSGKEGDEVRAPNSGVVALVDDEFYSGNSLVLDHGQGVYTMFFHLSKILVKPGQEVKKGDIIAHVGSTGRSTGPHLHWGVRMQGARVDPMELIKLKLE